MTTRPNSENDKQEEKKKRKKEKKRMRLEVRVRCGQEEGKLIEQRGVALEE